MRKWGMEATNMYVHSDSVFSSLCDWLHPDSM